MGDLNTSTAPQASWPGGVEGDSFVEFGGRLYFRAWTEAAGMELWSCDGTSAGTVQVSDLVPGPVGSDPRDLFVHGGLLYFTAHEASTGRELWRSDGTAAGTWRVLDLTPGPASTELVEPTSLGGLLYFCARRRRPRGRAVEHGRNRGGDRDGP